MKSLYHNMVRFEAAPRAKAFTLVEMLLVILIMSSLSLVAVEFVENEDDQLRYELTQDKLVAIQEAIITSTTSDRMNRSTLSGYAVDNGLLPQSLSNLLIKPIDYDTYSALHPVYDSSPDATTGLNNEPGVSLTEASETLFKGYRASGYLPMRPGNDVAYYDGWGNIAGLPNFGWMINSSTDAISVTSLGRDNLDNNPEASGYDTDLQKTILSDAWQADIEGWQVTIVNRSGTDLAIDDTGSGECIRISLLVYINDNDATTAYNWRRLTTECLSGNAGILSDGSCLDGDGDSLVQEVTCPQSKTVTFPATGTFQTSTRVPVGDHLLVLLIDDNATPHDGSSGETFCLDNTNCTSGSRVTRRVRFEPRSLLPLVNMEIGQ